jgi:uncharacterized Zn finger protein
MEYPSRDEIRSLCTEQSFERGVNYWNQGRIQELNVEAGGIRATVRGTHDYDVSIDIEDDAIYTRCSCPYDYAGDCKHIVAVLLAVEDRDVDGSDETGDESSRYPTRTTDIETLVEETSADELRTFLLDVVEDDRDLHDRFVAFAGEKTGKTVYDYKQEIDRLFEDAAGRRGMIEYSTHIDFSQHHDLAETHRKRGRVEAATDIYRAIGETIRENMNRVDDSSGYYGDELERAVEFSSLRSPGNETDLRPSCDERPSGHSPSRSSSKRPGKPYFVIVAAWRGEIFTRIRSWAPSRRGLVTTTWRSISPRLGGEPNCVRFSSSSVTV